MDSKLTLKTPTDFRLLDQLNTKSIFKIPQIVNIKLSFKSQNFSIKNEQIRLVAFWFLILTGSKGTFISSKTNLVNYGITPKSVYGYVAKLNTCKSLLFLQKLILLKFASQKKFDKLNFSFSNYANSYYFYNKTFTTFFELNLENDFNKNSLPVHINITCSKPILPYTEYQLLLLIGLPLRKIV